METKSTNRFFAYSTIGAVALILSAPLFNKKSKPKEDGLVKRVKNVLTFDKHASNLEYIHAKKVKTYDSGYMVKEINGMPVLMYNKNPEVVKSDYSHISNWEYSFQ